MKKLLLLLLLPICSFAQEEIITLLSDSVDSITQRQRTVLEYDRNTR